MMETVFALGALLVAAAAMFYAYNIHQQFKGVTQRLAAAEKALTFNQQSIAGLTSGAVGVDNRLRLIEAREKVLTERQDTFENQQVGDEPYGNAIRLVQQGATAARLVDELEISESEANLIVRLHGQS